MGLDSESASLNGRKFMSNAHAAHFDEQHPHGEHHEHHVTPAITLKLILGILLFFTVATVGIAQAERWATHELGIPFPLWVNVVVAMSIATVKSTFVLMYFMHLKHDNPINSIIFGFTLLAFVIFMFFTFLDINNRGYVDSIKGSSALKGGSGGDLKLSMKVPAYAGFSEIVEVSTGQQLFIGAVDARYAQLEAKVIEKHHRPIFEARIEVLRNAPTQAVKEMAAKKKCGEDEAVRRVAYEETIKKAQELAAPEAAKALASEFRDHLHHASGLPHELVLARIKEKIGVAAFDEIMTEAAGHGGHGPTNKDSSDWRSRAKKGVTPGLFESAPHGEAKPDAHGTGH